MVIDPGTRVHGFLVRSQAASRGVALRVDGKGRNTVSYTSLPRARRRLRPLTQEMDQMKRALPFIVGLALAVTSGTSAAAGDTRQLVELPPMMQQHMMSNMRDHLAAINEILLSLKADELDKAADIAESRLGMSSMESHGASHMAPFMPEAMRNIGTTMHHAASRFALVAQEGDTASAYHALAEITTNCVACHSAYRIR